MITVDINGQAAQFAQMGDLLVATTPVTRGQYYGDAEVDYADAWVTKLTRPEVLAWCQEHGVRLLTNDEWTRAVDAGIIGQRVAEGDVWEDVEPVGGGRVLRGGSWISDRPYIRAFARRRSSSDSRNDLIGFRVCLSSPIDEH